MTSQADWAQRTRAFYDIAEVRLRLTTQRISDGNNLWVRIVQGGRLDPRSVLQGAPR